MRNNPEPGDLYFLQRPRLRQSNHPHFVLVLWVKGDVAGINYLSSQDDLYRSAKDFMIRSDCKEFLVTGLSKSSYLIDGANIEVPLSALTDNRGKVTGELRKNIEDWWGDELLNFK